VSVFSLADEAMDADDDADADTVIIVTSGSEDEAQEAPVIVLSSDSEEEDLELGPAFAGFVQVIYSLTLVLGQWNIL